MLAATFAAITFSRKSTPKLETVSDAATARSAADYDFALNCPVWLYESTVKSSCGFDSGVPTALNITIQALDAYDGMYNGTITTELAHRIGLVV